MAALGSRVLRQGLRLRIHNVTTLRSQTGGKRSGSLPPPANKTLVSFPVKFSAGSLDSATGNGPTSRKPTAVQELDDEGLVYSKKETGSETGVAAGEGGSQDKLKNVGRGPASDEDSSSSSSSESDSDSEDGSHEIPKADAQTADENSSSARHGPHVSKKSHPHLELPVLGGHSAHTQPGEVLTGRQGEELGDQAPAITTKEGRRSRVPLGPSGAPTEKIGADGEPAAFPVSQQGNKEGKPSDKPHLIQTEGGTANVEVLGRVGADAKGAPLGKAESAQREVIKDHGEGELVGKSTSRETTSTRERRDPAEKGTAADTTPVPPSPSAPPAAPVSAKPTFDNTKYQNLQHHSYSEFTFVDLDLELSKVRLPQPSSGRPSPRD